MLLVSLLALLSAQADPAVPPPALTLTVQKLPATFKQNPVVSLVFNAKGQVAGCKVAKTSGHAGIDRVACVQATGNLSYPLEDGKAPAARDVTIGFETEAPKN